MAARHTFRLNLSDYCHFHGSYVNAESYFLLYLGFPMSVGRGRKTLQVDAFPKRDNNTYLSSPEGGDHGPK
jgi:hypothetical protein